MQISPTVKDPKRTNLFWWCQSREPNTDRCAQCWLLHLLRIFFFFFLNSKLFTFLINEARRSCEHRRRMQINFFEKIVEFRLKNYRKIGQIFWNKTENVSELTSIGIELKATTEPFVNGQRENRETSARARSSCQRIDGHFSSAGG